METRNRRKTKIVIKAGRRNTEKKVIEKWKQKIGVVEETEGLERRKIKWEE